MDVSNVAFPPVTGFLIASAAVTTLPSLIGWWGPGQLAYVWPAIWSHYEVWRLVTAFFYGGRGFPLIFDTFCLYRTSVALESSHFHDTAGYSWSLIVMCCALLAFNCLPLLRLPFLFHSMLSALIYLWSKDNPTSKVSIFGLITIPVRLYPFALAFLDLIQSGPMQAVGCVIGIVTGHLWWFLATYLPLHAPPHLRRRNPLSTPAWFRTIFWSHSSPSRSSETGLRSVHLASGVSATDYRPSRSSSSSSVRHRWGSGQKLGGS